MSRTNQAASAARRKRLGQYFSGLPLARLLAALSHAPEDGRVLDPMVGTGDMLLGALALGRPQMVAGIEIDPVAHDACVGRLPELDPDPCIIRGSAFSSATLRRLPVRDWDVVITNPPYVRYQSTAAAGQADMAVPSSARVRKDLLAALVSLETLEPEDKRLFAELAHGYSGFADLAVPSWILCAALVREGGRLAMVVPNTWLTRDYAQPIQYLLHRWFDLTCVVEDSDATWFSDALVRTNLVVATRVSRRDGLGSNEGHGYVRLRLSSDTATERSLVGGLFADSQNPELELAALVRRWKGEGGIEGHPTVAADWVSSAPEVRALEAHAGRSRWLGQLEGGVETNAGRTVALPPAMRAALRARPASKLIGLHDLGWTVGQGLRTGANAFFYLSHLDATTCGEKLQASAVLGRAVVTVPLDASVPVVQKQADLGDASVITASDLRGRVLVLDRYALPEDLSTGEVGFYQELPEDFANHVRMAARVRAGRSGKPIPELSAVVTNVRRPGPQKPARFWYQLPTFAPRHQPDLFLPRVNNGHVRTILNRNRKAVVDANFAALWADARAEVDSIALLAALTSTWCIATFEEVGTVLGGGALKLEASHLRRLALPNMSSSHWDQLCVLGRALLGDESKDAVVVEIDQIIFGAASRSQAESIRRRISSTATQRLQQRAA